MKVSRSDARSSSSRAVSPVTLLESTNGSSMQLLSKGMSNHRNEPTIERLGVIARYELESINDKPHDGFQLALHSVRIEDFLRVLGELDLRKAFRCYGLESAIDLRDVHNSLFDVSSPYQKT